MANITPDREKIKKLHSEASEVVELIDYCTSKASGKQHKKSEFHSRLIKFLNNYLELLEFRMQKEWGFAQDANYHTWWLKPKSCTCPKLDNTDPVYFGAGKIISEDCPVHGHKIKELEDDGNSNG